MTREGYVQEELLVEAGLQICRLLNFLINHKVPQFHPRLRYLSDVSSILELEIFAS